jgi:N-acylneuraminate cytidylyltransferase
LSAPSLALIPARGGSKRLPRKNILPFGGRPMLSWAVLTARDSGVFDRILVTTDDEEIAAIARSENADVLMRPREVSDDAATLADVIHHAMAACGREVARFCLLPPNCPLREASDIVASRDAFLKRRPPALLSVTSYAWTPPFRAQSAVEGRLAPYFAEWADKKSQYYPQVVCPSGAIYWSTPEAIAGARDLYLPGIEGYPLAWHRAIDIDTFEDYQIARSVRHAIDHGFSFET